MGKKKGGEKLVDAEKSFCYFCDKAFNDERILIQHQLTKHFRCPICPITKSAGKCNTLHGLIIHYRKVHTADLLLVPNAIQGRDDPSTSMRIVGMRFVPEEILEEWRTKGVAPEPPDISQPSILGAWQPDAMPVAGTGEMGELSYDPGMQVVSDPGMQAPEAPLSAEPGPDDWSQQVLRWMQARKETEADREKEEERRRPPPLPEPKEEPIAPPPSPPRIEEPRPVETITQPPVPAVPAFQFPIAAQQQDRSKQQAQAQDFAASFLAGALGNLEKAKAHATQAPPMFDATAAAAAAAAASASASAPARSRSRSRKRSPARAAGRDTAANNFASRTIMITTGAVTTRLWLKKEMERFGRVEVCHTGNRMNPEIEAPWVRFEKASSVETALEAINAGQCTDPHGVTIKAVLKSSSRPEPEKPVPSRQQATRRDLETNSRDLNRDNRRTDNHSSRDSRQDDRRRSPRRRSPRGRSPPRQQMGPGNFNSRDLAKMDAARRRRSPSSSSTPQRRLPMGPGNYSSRELAKMDARRRR